MNILFLSQRVPYPPNRGDKITTWRLIERMARTHEVRTLAFAHDEGDVQAAGELETKGYPITTVRHHERRKRLTSLPLLLTRKPLTLGVYGSRALQRATDELIEWADVAYAYSSSMGAFLTHQDLPWAMHFAELDSDKWRQYAERSRFPMSLVYKREWRTLLEYERGLAASAGQNIFCTPLEEAIFQSEIPGCPSTVVRNGVDLDFFQPAPEKTEPGHLVFTGVMDYLPNVDGCVHFVEEILPQVRAEFPDTLFTIIGSRPVPEVLQLAKTKGVVVTGFVDDIRDHLRKGCISVAPLRIARGIQNKVLEALAMGLPVVGTTSATQGVEGVAGEHFLLADSAADQASAIKDLLREPERARSLGMAGRRFVEGKYDWEVTLAPLDGILQECVAGRQPTSG